MLGTILNVLMPPGGVRRGAVRWVLVRMGWKPQDPYNRWRHEQADKIPFHPRRLHDHRPLVSLVVPAYNTEQRHLLAMLRSVVAQTYDSWELIVVDASTQPGATRRIADAVQMDTRIRLVRVENAGIAANTNAGIEAAGGEWVGFLDHDDLLVADALDEVVAAINADPDAGVVYSDEDKISDDGRKRLEPHFKPDWSPHLLEHVNYISHFSLVRADLLKRAGALDPEMDGAQDFDLLLRVTDLAGDLGASVVHVPKVLYHWRTAETSTAADFSNKGYVLAAGERALAAHFERTGVPATAQAIEDMPGFYRTVYDPHPGITLALAPFANPTLLRLYLRVLRAEGCLRGHEVLVPAAVGGGEGLVPVQADAWRPFLELLARRADGPVVVLADFLVPLVEGWAEALAGPLQDPTVHAVGPAVLNGDGIIRDMGLVRSGSQLVQLFRAVPYGVPSYLGTSSWPRDVDALTGAALAVRAEDLLAHVADEDVEVPDLRGVAATAPAGRYNLMWSPVTMEHVRVPLLPDRWRGAYSNRHLVDGPHDVWGHVDDQQMVDALMARLEELRREKGEDS